MFTKLTGLAVAGLFAASAASAATYTVDFEEFEHSDVVSEVSFGGVTASVSAVGNSATAPDLAVAFDTDLDGTADPDLEAPFPGDLYPGMVLIVQENPLGEADDDGIGGVITFMFDTVVDFLGFDVFDDATITATSDNGDVTIVDVLADGDSGTSGALEWLNVSKLVFDFHGSSGAIDNLQFRVSEVPVPASLPLLLTGFGAMAFMRRRRK